MQRRCLLLPFSQKPNCLPPVYEFCITSKSFLNFIIKKILNTHKDIGKDLFYLKHRRKHKHCSQSLKTNRAIIIKETSLMVMALYFLKQNSRFSLTKNPTFPISYLHTESSPFCAYTRKRLTLK